MPNAPQIRPIEMYWGALKQKVYAKNWSAKSRDQLIREMCKRNGFSNPCARMFENLRPRINLAKENGLDSLL